MGVLSVEKTQLRGDLTDPYKYFQGMSQNGARLCSVVPSDTMRSNGHELKHKFYCNLRKNFAWRVLEL